MPLDVVILAAGQGTRMRSSLPKVLHKVAGKAMVEHVVDAAKTLKAESIHTVIGHGAESVREQMGHLGCNWVMQEEQLGTGHAVAQALPQISQDTVVLVLYGDVPLAKPSTLQQLVACVNSNTMSLLTVKLDNPAGYGRIVRDANGRVTAIVEHKDATAEQLAIDEVNTGIMAVNGADLHRWLPQLSSENAQGEYYLTDVIAMAVAEGKQVVAEHPESHWEVQGVNNRLQLSELERYYQSQQALRLMTDGVTLADPSRIDVRGELNVGQDIQIDPNCIFEGSVELGDGVVIEANCIVRNSTVGARTIIKANSVIEDAVVAANCDIGPFARLRPGTQLMDKAKVGNFVETKKAVIGEGSKVNHLSYIGDATIGCGANIGAGTITCNYDGVNKSQTVIGDGAFIGSNSSLVAPVVIGNNATVGAGSTITTAVADDQLAVARGRQKSIAGWKRPEKKQ